jgi:hypothetical protein
MGTLPYVLIMFLGGWFFVGVVIGGFKFAKLLLHYIKIRKTFRETEEFIQKNVA